MPPGSLVDLVLIALIILFAVNGYRQGFLIGALTFGGFFGGALVGLQVAPFLVGAMDGALKFVKGDALAGVAIVLVNVTGGPSSRARL